MAKDKISIVCFSGEFDKALAAFTIATGAAASDYEVNMFFTFWGLNILKKKKRRAWIGKNFMSRFFNFLMGGEKNLPLSHFNFMGLSPVLMTNMMKESKVATLPDLIDMAKKLGVNFVACEMAMHILGIKKEDLIDEVKDVIGVVTFLDISNEAKIIFI